MIKVHSIETLGALDGPGIRTVVFFQGCPLRCAYCHNADMLAIDGGTERDEAELAAFCANFKPYYGKRGGVTLSGGEPLLQGAGALRLIKLLKREGIGVALDTSGAVFAPEVLSECKLVILDIKHTDADAFARLTGGKIDNTLKTLEFCAENNVPFWLRQVIVPGITDSDGQVLRLKELGQKAEKIELLPYHTMGAFKWEKSGLRYGLGGVRPTDTEVMNRLNALLKP